MGIDWWTLALQTINVLVLVWILMRFFFKPIAAIVADRQAAASKLLVDAKAERDKANAAREAADKDRAEINAERETSIAQARAAGAAEKAVALAGVAREIEKLRADAQAELDHDRAAAERDVVAHASDLSIDIARRLIDRLPRPAIMDALLANLSGALRSLSPDEKANLCAGAAKDGIEVVTAAPLSNDDKQAVRSILAETLSVSPQVRFSDDASLIEGIEVHARNTVVRETWRASLDRIREELGHGEHIRGS